MFKKSVVCLLLLFCFSVPVLAAKNWVLMGKTEEGFAVWMNSDIKPVAYNNEEGKTVVLKDIFTFDYKLVYTGNEVPLIGFYDLQTQKLLSSLSPKLAWEDDTGSDGFLYDAYLLKDYFNIMGKNPFILKNEFVPKKRIAKVYKDNNGWQEVTLRGSNRAWIQTKSAVISDFADGELPSLRVLVRYQTMSEGKEFISFAYESYNPQSRERQVLKRWDSQGKEIVLPKKEVSFVEVLSPDASIASAAYNLFLLDYSEIENRGQFSIDEEKVFFPKYWFDFAEKAK